MIHSPALSIHKPLTGMFWWRLDEPMKEEPGFGVLALRGKGWLSAFVAGKGPWCALKEPARVFQCYNFPGMENCNDVWGGRAWFEPGVWHHTAITASGLGMTLDDVVILDRALSGDEIPAYITAAKALARVRFPVRQGAD